MGKINKLLTARVLVSLLCISASGTVLATDYPDGISSYSTINLKTGDTVTSTSTGIASEGLGKIEIDGNPVVNVTGISGTGEARGIYINNNGGNNVLGEGTVINVANAYGSASGLKIEGLNTIISGSNLTFNVIANGPSGYANGINIVSGSTVDLGKNSKVIISGNPSFAGIMLGDTNTTFKADALQMTVDSSKLQQSVFMIRGAYSGSVIDLGTGSSLQSVGEGLVGGIHLSGLGSSLTAKELTLLTTNGEGIIADNGATINISDNSDLQFTKGDATGSYFGFGVFALNVANADNSVASTINLSDSKIMQREGKHGIVAANRGVVNLDNVTFKQEDAISNNYGIWATSAGKINIDKVDFQQTGGSFGLVVTAGGKITLTGENNLQTENAYLMLADGAGSSITGSGKETLVGSLAAQNSGVIDLSMTSGSYWSGASTIGVAGKMGTIDLSIEGDSAWHMTGDSTVSNLALTNGAAVYLSASVADSKRHTLTIAGDYTGNAGKFVFYGDLNGDTNTSVDQLVINGNVVLDTNKTLVSVKNIGGLGEKTIEGIKIITVTGDSPDAFTQDGRIVAGAYDYYLKQGNADGEDTKNWYLTNELSPVTPSVRPEAGAYLGNLYAANNMFQMSLHDRLGEVAYTADNNKDQDAWVRFDKRKVNMKTDPSGVDISQNYNVVQVGYDLLRKDYSKGDKKSFVVAGIMGGYGDTSTTAKGTEYNATGSLHGFSVGPYATWYRESDDKSGSYVDVWALWNRFDGTTNGEGIDSESYRLQGMVLSAEVGYDQLLSKRASKNESNRFLKWQGQVTYQGVDGGNKVESNGTVVDLSHRNVQTRLGVRYYSKPNGLKTSYNQPYVELNWYHNTNPTETQLDETKVSLQGTSNIGGIKVGSEYKINESMELWGYGFYAKGGDGYNSYGIRLGIKDMF